MSPFEPPSNVKAPLLFDEQCWGPLSHSGREFVTQLLAKEPSERITAVDALEHPWLSQAAMAPRSLEREKYAPRVDASLCFLPASQVFELWKEGGLTAS